LNKVAVITGSSKGIGFALAKMFLSHGFSVAICARHHDSLQSAAAHLVEFVDSAGLAGRVFWKVVDIGNPNDAQVFISDAARTLGGIDVLVNNAAIIETKPFEEMTCEELSSVANANVLGVWVCTRAAIPYLKRSSLHTVVNISSEMDDEPRQGFVAYSSSKGAVTTFTKALALEFQPQVIKVLGIRPSRVRTTAWDRVRAGDDAYYIPDDVAGLLEELLFVLPESVHSGQVINLSGARPIQKNGGK
jgi:NAD(P)-dependent dehydrogenase (short-subunit alcohol dehydrogenase family)